MLYFSKLRIISVFIFTIVISYFALSNFFKFDDNFFSKNINLGLDLQGGSYLLLEIDNKPVITQKLQSKIIELKKHFKEKNLILKNFSIKENSIIFEAKSNDVDIITNILDNEESENEGIYTFTLGVDDITRSKLLGFIINQLDKITFTKQGLPRKKG